VEGPKPGEVDFLDFGASKGGSILFCRKTFAAPCGVGVDLDPAKVTLMRQSGFACLQGDSAELDLPKGLVRFVSMVHFLEHLPGLGSVRAVLNKARELARDFLYLQGPNFDADQELAALGLKCFWSDWYGHTCPLRTGQLAALLREMGLEFQFFFSGAIRHSDDPALHPLSSPPDQVNYAADQHPEKVLIPLPFPFFREWHALVKLREFSEWSAIQARLIKATKTPLEALNPSEEAVPHHVASPLSGPTQSAQAVMWPEWMLLCSGKWAYLEWLHLRRVIEDSGVESVLLSAQSSPFLGMALARSYHQIRVGVVAKENRRNSISQRLKAYAKSHNLQNLQAEEEPEKAVGKWDLVFDAFNIQTPSQAGKLEELHQAAKVATCLVLPFVRKNQKRNDAQTTGFTLTEAAQLQPGIKLLRGFAWQDSGQRLKSSVAGLSSRVLGQRLRQWEELALNDTQDRLPEADQAGCCVGLVAWLAKDRTSS
jgi:hypothetical protein